MPKQIWKIDEFHGGVNSNADPRDILNNELADATDVSVNELGKMRMLGSNTETHTQPDAGGNTMGLQPGYGFFTFSNDMDGADEAGDLSLSQTNYLALTDTREGSYSVIDISAGGGTWSDGSQAGDGVGVSTSNSAKIDMYYVDGALRANDVDFGANSSPTWYGYVGDNGANKTMMSDTTTSVSVTQKFYDLPAKPDKPIGTFLPDQPQGGDSNESGSQEYTATDIGGRLQTEGTGADSAYTIAHGSITGASVDTVHSIIVQIQILLDSEGNPLKGNWQYDLTVRQAGGGSDNSITISDVSGSGAMIKEHIFSHPDGVSVGTTDWEVVLNVDSWHADVLAINVKSVKFQKSPSSFADHTAVLSNNSHVFHIDLDQPGSDVTNAFGWDENWQIGMSLIYDDNQESLIQLFNNKTTASEDTFAYTDGKKPPYVTVFCQYSSSWNKRITGAVVYMKRLLDKQWYPQFELDFEKGIGKSTFSAVERTATYIELGSSDEAHYLFSFMPEDILEPQQAITYESRTGISHNEKSITSMWKTSCVANRRAYIGNLKIFNEDGTTEIHGDKMVRSLPNKFDIFPISESVDVTINDGESIVALTEFNDRILQFKERTLYIINASQDVEFLEDKLDYRGVSHKASVFKTEYGVVWANKNGCFFYDGRKVNDLLEKQGRPLVKQKDWKDFLGTYPLVGYSPKKRQIIVVDDISNNDNGAGSASNGSCYVYDMITQSWVKGAAGTFDATSKSNFIIDWNGDLLHVASANTNDSAGALELYKWNDSASTSANMSVKTKDIDFGSPSQKKSVKKVYISYRGDARNVQVQYAVNGDNDTYSNFFLISSDGSSTNGTGQAKSLSFSGADGSTPGVDDWVCAELKPAAGSVTCNSFAIKISGDGSNAIAADFEINDISIVYRPKSIK